MKKYNKIAQQIIDDAEAQLEIQGSFGRVGSIYWNTAEQYIRRNCSIDILNKLLELKNTDADCYCSDLRLDKFLETLNVILEGVKS